MRGLRLNSNTPNVTVIDNPITLNAVPTLPNHVTNKIYVDTSIEALRSDTIDTGDIVVKTVSISPPGFLATNGAYVNKTTFANLFNVIGHTYDNVNSFNMGYTSFAALGAGQPWRQQYDFNFTSNLSLFNSEINVLPSTLFLSSVVVTRNRVFILGGSTNGTNAFNTIFSATINSDGSINNFINAGTLPVALSGSSIVVTRNRVFLLGGWNGSATLTSIFTAVINADGTLGTFTTHTSTLPAAISKATAFVTRNRVFLLGGSTTNTNTTNTIFSANIDINGDIGTFASAGTIPSNLIYSTTVVTQNRVFLIGGTSTGTNAISTVWNAVINSDGTIGAFTTVAGILPVNLSRTTSLVTRNRVFLFGGWNGTSSVNFIYIAPLNNDGTIRAFSVVGNLPTNVNRSVCLATTRRVYIIGGHSTAHALSINLFADFIEDGGLNNYEVFYNGSINTFGTPGAAVSGTLVIDEANPDPVSLFRLPNISTRSLGTNLFSYIKT